MFLPVVAAIISISLFRILWSRRAFYQLSWQLPGPFAWPLIGNALEFADWTKIVPTVDGFCATYSKCFRFWMGTRFFVVYTDPESMEQILNSPDTIEKGDSYKQIGTILGGDGLTTSSGDEWKMHRKLLNPPIQNYNILNSFYPIFNQQVRKLVKRLEQYADGDEINVYHYVEACTLDSTCETTFGTKMYVQDGQNTDFLENTNNVLNLSSMMIFQPWLQYDAIFKWSKWYPKKKSCQIGCRSYALRILEEKIAAYKVASADKCGSNDDNVKLDLDGQTKKRKYFIEECIRLSLVEKSFSIDDIVNESLVMLIGGFETTAITVSYIILMLAMHPEHQQRVFDEVSDIIPMQMDDVTAEHIGRLDFTNRAIKESMRLNTTIPLITRTAVKDTRIGEYMIPQGTELLLAVHAMHRQPRTWGPSSASFDPDRFLPERLANMHAYSFLPFSGGQRNCIGMKYANIVVRIFVCWLVRNYRFTTSLKMGDLRHRMTLSLQLDNGHMVRIHRRNTKE